MYIIITIFITGINLCWLVDAAKYTRVNLKTVNLDSYISERPITERRLTFLKALRAYYIIPISVMGITAAAKLTVRFIASTYLYLSSCIGYDPRRFEEIPGIRLQEKREWDRRVRSRYSLPLGRKTRGFLGSGL